MGGLISGVLIRGREFNCIVLDLRRSLAVRYYKYRGFALALSECPFIIHSFLVESDVALGIETLQMLAKLAPEKYIQKLINLMSSTSKNSRLMIVQPYIIKIINRRFLTTY